MKQCSTSLKIKKVQKTPHYYVPFKSIKFGKSFKILKMKSNVAERH